MLTELEPGLVASASNVVEIRFVFVRYCWPALTARKFYGRRQKTIDCLNLSGAHALVLFLPPGGPARMKSHSLLFPTSATYQANNLSIRTKSSAGV